MIDPNRMTVKLQEALQQAGGIATRRNHQGIDVEHLLAALLEQRRGSRRRASSRRRALAPRAARDAVERELGKRPQVRGAGGRPGPALRHRSA